MAATGFTLPKGSNSHLLLERALVSWSSDFTEEEKGGYILYDTYDHLLLRKRSSVVWTKSGLRRLDTRSFSLGAENCPLDEGPLEFLGGTLGSSLRLPVALEGRRLPALAKLSVCQRSFIVRPPASLLPGDSPVVSGRLIVLQGERFLFIDTAPDAGTLEVLTEGLRAQGAQVLDTEWFTSFLVRHGVTVFRPVVCSALVPSTLLGVRSAVAGLALGLLDNARYFEGGIEKDIDPECVHQYRLLVRKLRSLVSLCQKAFLPEDLAFLSTSLKAMGAASANLRDLDLQLESLPGQKAQVPQEQAAHLGAWEKFLVSERARVLAQVRLTLGSKEYGEGAARIERFLETWYKAPPQASSFTHIGSMALDCLEKLGRKVLRSCQALSPTSPDEDFHRWRIGLKKLRYLLEFFEALFPAKERTVLYKKVMELLTLLGEFQDSSVRIAQLLEGVKGPDLGLGAEERFALGMLAGLLLGQHRRLKKSIYRNLGQFRGGSIKNLVKACSAVQTGAYVK